VRLPQFAVQIVAAGGEMEAVQQAFALAAGAGGALAAFGRDGINPGRRCKEEALGRYETL